ncbi:hypothetical protein V9T40_007673 [Parthenolecanium corni]|uniref:Uncharacterized protein n=1 Tax=Parthenolecanium corni TaxID=536013 RepID=A0AAN9TM38_9HEMI
MSFFNSLQQYVTSSVANLSLSPKRFSLSKESSAEGAEDLNPPGAAGRSASTGSVSSIPGFPKVVPSPGVVVCSSRRKTLECPKKMVSFRQSSTQQQRQIYKYCKRRLSWPEIDQQQTSGVQETDNFFLESYSALSWNIHNRQLMAGQDLSQEEPPPSEASVGIKPPPMYRITSLEMEQLYIEVLYTIKYKVGSSCGQTSQYQEELYAYAQKAFKVSNEMHRRYLSIASEEKLADKVCKFVETFGSRSHQMQHPAFVVDTLIFVAFTLTEYEYIVPAINFKALRSVMVTKEDNFKI